MLIAKSRYGQGGTVVFAEYANGDTAIIIESESGEREGILTVCIVPAPKPGPDQVWVKTWSENEGILEAAIVSGIIHLPEQYFQVNPYGAIAVLANLTPAALAERETQRKSNA